jgi:short-subunit dehydrogenase
MKLQAKTILITGASTGIGRALALELAGRDCRLILIARRKELLQDLVKEMGGGDRHLFFVCDVAEHKQVAKVCRRLIDEKILPDALILNAGVGGGYRPLQMDIADIQQQFAVNFWHPLYFLETLLPAMTKRGSGIVAITGTLAAYRGMPRSAPYSASKAAIHRFLESLRVDLWGSGLQFTLISPGFVKTPMTDRNRYPMPFMISAEKAARIIVAGLEHGRTEIRFPAPMVLVVRFAKLLPGSWWARLMHGRRKD